ncbi:hypothetical protein DNT45_09350, partial [Campylobacter coli]|nr:hypothetical protein [Campylobacter coli]
NIDFNAYLKIKLKGVEFNFLILFIRDQPSYFNVFYMDYKDLNEKKLLTIKNILRKGLNFFEKFC